MPFSPASGEFFKGSFVSLQSWITKFVALVVACVVFIVLIFDLRNGLLALESMFWRKAAGKIADVEIDKHGNRYAVEVTYEFDVNGESLHGTRYGMLQYNGKRHFKTRDRAESWAQVGTPLTVRYHRDDPDRNFVVDGVPRWLLFVSAKVVLLAVSVLFLWPTKVS